MTFKRLPKYISASILATLIGVISAAQAETTQAPLAPETTEKLMNTGDFTPSKLNALEEALNVPVSSEANRVCITVRNEFPIYNLAPEDFKIVNAYRTSCAAGTHSISVNNRVSGRGWLIAYIFKKVDGKWVEVEGGLPSESYYGGAGEYRLVAYNRGREASTGHAKTAAPF